MDTGSLNCDRRNDHAGRSGDLTATLITATPSIRWWATLMESILLQCRRPGGRCYPGARCIVGFADGRAHNRRFTSVTAIFLLSLGGTLTAPMVRAGETAVKILPAIADTFSRADAPTSTYGSAGALHVSGAAAQNAMGEVQGMADSWLRFDTTSAIQQFNLELGAGKVGRGESELADMVGR